MRVYTDTGLAFSIGFRDNYLYNFLLKPGDGRVIQISKTVQIEARSPERLDLREGRVSIKKGNTNMSVAVYKHQNPAYGFKIE